MTTSKQKRSAGSGRHRLGRRLRTEWQQLTTVQSHPRRWPMPVAAALSTGLPLLCGAYFGDMRAGLIGSLGGIAFLHLPETPFHHRMVRLMACAYALAACYSMGLAIGQVSGLWLKIPLVTVLALMITLSVRYYRLPPPGPIFSSWRRRLEPMRACRWRKCLRP